MKVLSRDFTRREKILLLLLALILVGLVYYRFVDQTVREAVTTARTESEALNSEITAYESRLMHLRDLQNQLDTMEEENNLSYMPSYNASKEEVAFLNDILANTINYSISFSNVTRAGDQIRRMFTLQYETTTLEEASLVMQKLCSYENRCRVGDIRCTISETGYTTISAAATFYETMVGGKADAGLPADSATTNR